MKELRKYFYECKRKGTAPTFCVVPISRWNQFFTEIQHSFVIPIKFVRASDYKFDLYVFGMRVFLGHRK